MEYIYVWLLVTLKDLQGAGHNISAATIIQLRVSKIWKSFKMISTPHIDYYMKSKTGYFIFSDSIFSSL